MNIWHKRNEFPHGFIEENKLFVYVFDDGTDLTEYCEQYHKASNLKKWCVFNELLSFEKKNKALQEKLEIAIKALITYKNLRYDGSVTNYESIAKEALAKIKEIK